MARVLLKLYKATLPAGKKPGRALCAAKPLKKPLAAQSFYILRRGRNFLGRPGLTHSLSIFARPPLPKHGSRRFLDEALGFHFPPWLVCIHRGSSPPPRKYLHFCFCLGSCRAFKGHVQNLTPFFITNFVFPGQSLSKLLSPCSRL